MERASLDIEQPDPLRDYLRATNRISSTEQIGIKVLSGGVSNRTVLVELPDRPGNQAWVLKQALAKLRVAVDWFSDPARIDREALGLHWLTEPRSGGNDYAAGFPRSRPPPAGDGRRPATPRELEVDPPGGPR